MPLASKISGKYLRASSTQMDGVKKLHPPYIFTNQFSYPTAQDCTYQNIRVQHQTAPLGRRHFLRRLALNLATISSVSI